MRTKLWTVAVLMVKPAKDPHLSCAICNEILGKERLDGGIEYASILPCSHVFGSVCISRWLEKDSLHQDCPLCRRSMIYRECGHIIKSCDVDRAPKCVREKDMPSKCPGCRGAERLDQDIKLRRERRKLGEDRTRQGLVAKMHLPWGLRRSRANSLEWNVEEFRRDWRAEIDAIFGNVEQDRRDQW